MELQCIEARGSSLCSSIDQTNRNAPMSFLIRPSSQMWFLLENELGARHPPAGLDRRSHPWAYFGFRGLWGCPRLVVWSFRGDFRVAFGAPPGLPLVFCLFSVDFRGAFGGLRGPSGAFGGCWGGFGFGFGFSSGVVAFFVSV